MEIEINPISEYIRKELIKTNEKLDGKRETQYDKKALELKAQTLVNIQDIICEQFGKKWVELSQ